MSIYLDAIITIHIDVSMFISVCMHLGKVYMNVCVYKGMHICIGVFEVGIVYVYVHGCVYSSIKRITKQSKDFCQFQLMLK